MEQAKHYESEGSQQLHIVDLDGAQHGSLQNKDLISKIVEQTQMKVQIGGGIRHYQQVKDFLSNGVARVVVGSLAVSQPDSVLQWIEEFSCERIVVALDVICDETMTPYVVSHGWQEKTKVSLWDLLDKYAFLGACQVLCTDVHCDGTLEGPNFELYQQARDRFPQIRMQASGGVRTIADLKTLDAMGMHAAIIGKALLEQKFTLSQATQALAQC